MTTPVRMLSRRPRRGVALMLVLWMTVAVGAVAAATARLARTEMNAVGNGRAYLVGRYAAESGIAVTVARIDSLLRTAATPDAWAEIFKELDSRLDLEETSVGNGRFAAAVTDVSARLDINRARESMLLKLFEQFTDQREAERAVAAIGDWIDHDDHTRVNGAETDAYLAAGSPFVPPNRPIRRLHELGRIIGVGDSLAALVVPYLTVDGDSRVNINTAAEPVLAALPGMTREGARTLVTRRDAGELFTSANVLMPLLGANFEGAAYFVRLSAIPIPSRILVVSRGWMPGHPLTQEIQAVYSISGTQLRLQSWQERAR